MLQFDVTYNEEDFENDGVQNNQQDQESNPDQEEEDDDDNPMTKKLQKMKTQLRNQMNNDDKINFKGAKQEKQFHFEFDEDNQGYDDYKSPHKQISNDKTFPSVSPIVQRSQEEAKKPPAQGNQIQVGVAPIGATNYDKIKNSKLFQKFLQQETGQAKKEESQLNQAASSKVSSQNQLMTATFGKGKIQQASQQQKTQIGIKQQPKKEDQKAAKGKPQENILDMTNQSHDDFFDSKVKQQMKKHSQQQQQFRGQYMNDPGIDISLDAIQSQPQSLDDSHFYQNPLPMQLQNGLYPQAYFQKQKILQQNQNYLLDQSDNNNECELIGYSEQILDAIIDMAPGVPTQDEVLPHPEENFQKMIHDQFNNEIPWLIRNKLGGMEQVKEFPMNNGGIQGQSFDMLQQNHHQIQPMRQEMFQMKEEMRRMKEDDYDYVKDRFQQLQDKYNTLQLDYNKDKQFYEEALEVRMSQYEQLEDENSKLNSKYEEAKKNELDLQAQIDQIMFDKDMIQRNLKSTNQTKQELNKKEEELYSQVRNLEDKLRDKDYEIERGQNDQSRLKTQIERANQEIERLKQQLEYQESNVMQKDQEKTSIMSQINDLKQRLQQEQTDSHYVKNENEELKNEILLLKQQINMANNVQEQLRSQLFELKSRVGESEHREFLANSNKDLMQKEIQQLRLQLNQANQFIQQQSMFYNQAQANGNIQPKPPVFQVQPTTSWEDDTSSTQTRDSVVPTAQAKRRAESRQDSEQQYVYGTQQQQNHQLRSKNVSTILSWDDQPTNMQPNKPQQKSQVFKQSNMMESNINFPSRSDQADPSNKINFPSGQQQTENSISFPSKQNNQKSVQPPESNIAFPSRYQKQKSQNNMESYEPPMGKTTVARNQQSVSQLGKPQPDRTKQLQNIESNLLQLNLERDKYKAEFDKIPENAKTIVQRRRREELERELEILGKNIGSLKTKLRELESHH